MISSKHTTLAAAVLAVAGLGTSGLAHAGAEAYANLNILNFRLFNNATNTQVDASDFTSLNAGNSGSITAQLNGGSSNSQSAGPILGNIALPQVLGTGSVGAPGDNSWDAAGPGPTGTTSVQGSVAPPNPIPTPIGQQFARADADLVGSIITGLPGQSFADARQVSEVTLQVSSGLSNNGTSSLGTGTQFVFVPAKDGIQLRFEADVSGQTYAAQDIYAVAGISTASFSFNINIRILGEQNPIYVFAPVALGGASNVSQGSPGSTGYLLPAGTTFSSLGGNVSPALTAGTTYVLTINSNTQAGATVTQNNPIPEIDAVAGTGALTLMAGALALGSERRRRRS